jgi:hypothetical protein
VRHRCQIAAHGSVEDRGILVLAVPIGLFAPGRRRGGDQRAQAIEIEPFLQRAGCGRRGKGMIGREGIGRKPLRRRIGIMRRMRCRHGQAGSRQRGRRPKIAS